MTFPPDAVEKYPHGSRPPGWTQEDENRLQRLAAKLASKRWNPHAGLPFEYLRSSVGSLDVDEGGFHHDGTYYYVIVTWDEGVADPLE